MEFDPHKPENRPLAKELSRQRDEELMNSGEVTPAEMQEINGGAVKAIFKKYNAVLKRK